MSSHSQDADPALYRVQVGEVYLYKEQELLNVRRIIFYPDENQFNERFDVALMQLTALLLTSTHVSSVSLPKDSSAFNSTDSVGWLAGATVSKMVSLAVAERRDEGTLPSLSLHFPP